MHDSLRARLSRIPVEPAVAPASAPAWPEGAGGEVAAIPPPDRICPAVAPPSDQGAGRPRRILPPLLFALFAAVLGLALLPRGVESGRLLAVADDPVALADHVVAQRLDPARAGQEIEEALLNGDAELAQSMVDLAAAHHLTLDPDLLRRVAAANAPDAVARHSAMAFTRGLITGEPDDMASLAGTTLGDLFVFGDLRDAAREGTRFAKGEQVDELVLGLACVGIAITAGTYASVGAAAPLRVGVSLVKAARKTGRIGARMGTFIGRSLREAVDPQALRRAFAGASAADPALALRAAREVVKVDKSRALMRLATDVGQIQAKAGTRAALDAMKLAEGPRDVARLAKLAEKQGGKTRAILKIAGRGAIVLAATTWDLASWLLWAGFMVFWAVASLKSAAERSTLRYVRWRKARRGRRAAAQAAGAAA